jgi:hypothetical protein
MIDGKEVSPTSSESMSMRCPNCGMEGRRHVWVNTVLRAVQIKEVCYSCDYEKFEPWAVVDETYPPNSNQKAGEPHRDGSLDTNESDPKHQRAAVVPTKKTPKLYSLPVTLDDWHRALGFHKCATCGTPVGNGIPFAWQGKNRWCEECFWDEDGEVPDLDALENPENGKGKLS